MSNSQHAPVALIFAVTGHAEVECVPAIIRKCMRLSSAVVKIGTVSRVRQRPRLRIRAKGSQKCQVLPEHEKLAREIPKLVRDERSYFLWIDDLENEEDRKQPQPHFDYYARLLDDAVHAPMRERCSIHFLVNMLEAYFLADTSAVNTVLQPFLERPDTSLKRHQGDCENIKNPKGTLVSHVKHCNPTKRYIETTHGPGIARQLDIEQILSNPNHCRALRTLVAWCWEAIGEARTDQFQLLAGVYWDVTAHQLSIAPSSVQVGPLAAETNSRPQ